MCTRVGFVSLDKYPPPKQLDWWWIGAGNCMYLDMSLTRWQVIFLLLCQPQDRAKCRAVGYKVDT